MKRQKKTFPCWKVQLYDTLTLSWRTIPKTYTSLKLAETVAMRLPVQKVRLMQFNSDKNHVLLPELKKLNEKLMNNTHSHVKDMEQINGTE